MTKTSGNSRSVSLTSAVLGWVLVAGAVGCGDDVNGPAPSGITAQNHPGFPIGAGATHAIGRDLGDSVIGCESCHTTSAGSFTQFSCIDCHAHAQDVTDRLHLAEPQYAFASASCYSCHASGAKVAFDHAGITDNCAMCHDPDKPYAALPPASAGHTATSGLDCSSCHGASQAGGWTSWAGGQFHKPGSTAPGKCLPCHEGEAPTSTTGWRSTTYAASPFDYGTNSLGISHGGDQDCATCHTSPGTGAWGQDPNWVGGHFSHGTFTLAETSCGPCHLSQRPDLQPGATAATAAALVGFDHAPYAALDCIGCHAATVAAETYVDYLNPATSALPGGDWKGGQSYPGATPTGFPGEHIELQATTLAVDAASGLVTGATTAWQDVRDFMIHTSIAIPPEMRPGPAEAPDYGKCWHCHLNKDGVVTGFPMGKFHPALAQYAATPDGPVTPLPQPTQGCVECHAATQPTGIVKSSTLQPMNHGIAFAAPITVAGATATRVKDLDCSICHHDPTGVFRGGEFHPNVPTAALADCVTCHYVTMADGPTADVQVSATDRMKHTSAEVTIQSCPTCHPAAVANAATSPVAAASWQPGQYHSSLSVAPTTCADCHVGG
jgi:hypothetical protein